MQPSPRRCKPFRTTPHGRPALRWARKSRRPFSPNGRATRQRSRHLSPAHHARCVGADHAAALSAIRNGQAVGHGERESVPPGSAARAQQCAVCARLQRNQGDGRSEKHEADRRAVRRRALLDAAQSRARLVPGGRQVSDRQGASSPESARVRADVHGARQLLHRRLGRQVSHTISGGRSPRSATATRTATTRPSATPAGSL